MIDRLTRKIVAKEGSAGRVVEDDSQFSYENQLDATLLSSAVNGVASLGFSSEPRPPFSTSSFSNAATQPGNPLGLIEGTFSISRDVTGEVASVTKGSEYIFQKGFDAAGRLTSATAGDFTTTISHDGFGRKQTLSHSSGTTGNFQFDLLNRLTGLQWSGATPISEALGYDLAGNITTLERENSSYQIAYDAIDQLVSSTSTGANPYNRDFTFDLLGNRIASSVDGPGNFVNNFLTSNNTSSFLADPNGFGETVQEVTNGVTTNFTYRADGLLNGVQKGSMQAAYYFDALGRRVVKVINTGSESFTQSFLHLGLEDRILQGKAGDGSITTYVDGLNVDEHLFEVKNGVGKGYVFDHLQSILNSDAAGAAHAYGLHGEQLATLAVSASSSPVIYGHTGKEHDAESGLDYHGARNRNKRTSTWLSQDPIGLVGGDNFYGYVNGNPVRFVDPDGLRPVGPPVSETEATIAKIQNYLRMAAEAHPNDTKKMLETAYKLALGARYGKFKDTSRAGANADHFLDSLYRTYKVPVLGSVATSCINIPGYHAAKYIEQGLGVHILTASDATSPGMDQFLWGQLGSIMGGTLSTYDLVTGPRAY